MIIEALAQKLLSKSWRIATAESCTGGGLAQLLTSVAGSSNWFERGFVTYSNESKVEMLGVKPQTLKKHGAVSEEVAREMAEGALENSHADVSVAITGIAGPDGGSLEKPVGTVWFAWCVSGETFSECRHFEGDRASVREQAVAEAIKKIIQDFLAAKDVQ